MYAGYFFNVLFLFIKFCLTILWEFIFRTAAAWRLHFLRIYILQIILIVSIISGEKCLIVCVWVCVKLVEHKETNKILVCYKKRTRGGSAAHPTANPTAPRAWDVSMCGGGDGKWVKVGGGVVGLWVVVVVLVVVMVGYLFVLFDLVVPITMTVASSM